MVHIYHTGVTHDDHQNMFKVQATGLILGGKACSLTYIVAPEMYFSRVGPILTLNYWTGLKS
jgi:hypothetical protein